MDIPRYPERHPYWFAALLETAVIVTYLLAGTLAYFFGLSNMALYGLANLTLSILAIVMLIRLGWWQTVGFRRTHRPRDLFYYLAPFIPVGLNLLPGVQLEDSRYIFSVLAVTLLVAFAEETIFRGLMLQTLKTRGLWTAAVFTALLFGLAHGLNALAGKSPLGGLLQIGYAAAIGFTYAALVLTKEVLWPLVLTHFLTDFAFFIQKPGFTLPPTWQTALLIGLTIGFTAYGVVVMRLKPVRGETSIDPAALATPPMEPTESRRSLA